MKCLATVLILLSIITCGCNEKESEKYKKAYAQGVAEAQIEISSNTRTLYVMGKGHGPNSPKIDTETGLPFNRLAGCLVTDADKERLHGHNKTILENLKEKRP